MVHTACIEGIHIDPGGCNLIKRLLILSVAALAFVTLLLTISTATVVATGIALHYFAPAIPLEFACVVAGLAILIAFAFLSGVLRFLQLARFPPVQLDDDEVDEEEPEEFAEQIAELVSEKLEPHFWQPRRSKSRRR